MTYASYGQGIFMNFDASNYPLPYNGNITPRNYLEATIENACRQQNMVSPYDEIRRLNRKLEEKENKAKEWMDTERNKLIISYFYNR